MTETVAPPHIISDPAAEEYVIGAMMLSPVAIDNVRQILQPRDFYRASNALMYRVAVDLHDIGTLVDAITLADEIEARGKLEEVGGRDRIREIATLVPAASNAPHHAKIVAKKARLRRQEGIGEMIARRARANDDPDEIDAEAEQLLHENRGGTTGTVLQGLTHDEVLALHLEQERELISGLVPAGAVGTIAGVPETHKSWLAQAVAVRVARGTGWILGCEVTTQGPVGYFWQDDSTREEAERVKLFEQTHANPANLPIRWYLNEGLALPQDLRQLREIVEQHQFVLIVLDSFYNFLPGVDLKDEQAEQVVSLLKREISDATGCTVLIVDHMPWATEANRGRLRAYGGVFKNAATRFGIYIDAVADKLHIEARGNNITGIPKRLAYWDPDTLELKLLASDTPEEELKAPAGEIRDYVHDQGGDVLAKVVRAHFEISSETLTRRIGRLADLGIDYIGTRGRPARLVARHDEEPVENPVEQTAIDLDESNRTPEVAVRQLEDRAETFPHNHAGQNEVTASNRTNGERQLESGDMQGKEKPQGAAPYGSAPARARASAQPAEPTDRIDRLAAQHAWINTGGWMNDPLDQALLEHFPMTGPHDLEKLHAYATEVAARELGQVTP